MWAGIDQWIAGGLDGALIVEYVQGYIGFGVCKWLKSMRMTTELWQSILDLRY